jgi:hypothetical protein
VIPTVSTLTSCCLTYPDSYKGKPPPGSGTIVNGVVTERVCDRLSLVLLSGQLPGRPGGRDQPPAPATDRTGDNLLNRAPDTAETAWQPPTGPAAVLDVSEPPSRVQVVSETARAHRRRHAATLCPRIGSCAPGANAAHRKTRQADRPRRGADQPADHSTNPTRTNHRTEDLRRDTSPRTAVFHPPVLAVWTGGTLPPRVHRARQDFLLPLPKRRCHVEGLPVSTGKRPRLCTLGEPVQPPPTPPNDRPLPEQSDHRPHVTTQILGEWYAALVDTGAAGSFIGDHLRDKCNRHLRPVTPTIQSARMAYGQVDTITEAYWISLQIGTTTIRGKYHHLPHLPSDLVLGIDLLRRYPFSIDLKEGSASLRPPTTADEVQPTQAQPAFQVSDSPPLTLSPDEEQRLRQFLVEELPLFDSVRGLTPLARHEIRLLHPEPVKQRYRPRNPFMQGIIDEEVDKMLAEGVCNRAVGQPLELANRPGQE